MDKHSARPSQTATMSPNWKKLSKSTVTAIAETRRTQGQHGPAARAFHDFRDAVERAGLIDRWVAIRDETLCELLGDNGRTNLKNRTTERLFAYAVISYRLAEEIGVPLGYDNRALDLLRAPVVDALG